MHYWLVTHYMSNATELSFNIQADTAEEAVRQSFGLLPDTKMYIKSLDFDVVNVLEVM